jgi:hypothetical protein
MSKTIDLITVSPSGDTVYLIMTIVGTWNGSNERLRKVQDRFNDYMSFALDGEMARRFPELLGKKVHLRIDCECPPDPASMSFLDKLREVGGRDGVSLSVELLPPPPQT